MPIYRLLSAVNHRSFTAFQVKINLTFKRHRDRNAVTSKFLCRTVHSRSQCGNATELRCSMKWPSCHFTRWCTFLKKYKLYQNDWNPSVLSALERQTAIWLQRKLHSVQITWICQVHICEQFQMLLLLSRCVGYILKLGSLGILSP